MRELRSALHATHSWQCPWFLPPLPFPPILPAGIGDPTWTAPLALSVLTKLFSSLAFQCCRSIWYLPCPQSPHSSVAISPDQSPVPAGVCCVPWGQESWHSRQHAPLLGHLIVVFGASSTLATVDIWHILFMCLYCARNCLLVKQ